MEALKQKIERIMNTVQLEGEDLYFWKDIQLRLGGNNQIQLTDSIDQALEKLKKIGIEE